MRLNLVRLHMADWHWVLTVLCSLFGGSESIRDFIAFPKNNSGRDVMIDSPSPIAQAQLDELAIRVVSL